MPTQTQSINSKRIPRIKLPGHLQLSERELANTARLVRVLRTPTWLGYFIEALLEMDASQTNDVSVKQVKDALSDFDNLADWERVLGLLNDRYPNLRYHPSIT